MDPNHSLIAYTVMMAAQLSSALEVSGTPKPGNVHRNSNFIDTRFEHFLAGSIALGPSIRKVTIRGIRASLSQIDISEIGIGKYIKKSIRDIKSWHTGGNTHLGTSMLFIPLAASAGFTIEKFGKLDVLNWRKVLHKIMESTTEIDSMDLTAAILNSKAEGLGHLNSNEMPDLLDDSIQNRIMKEQVTLFDLMKISSKWDNIAKELTTGLKISFNLGYSSLLEYYNKTHDINITTVNTFLKILAKYPDTFIARKVGLKKEKDIEKAFQIGLSESSKVSKYADKVLQLGGLSREKGIKAAMELDNNLKDSGYNPGTTADITASSMMIAILQGLRP